MKITKLKHPVLDYQLVDKVNEIIDFLNKSFITEDADTITVDSLQNLVDITCDTLTPRTNEHTLNEIVADKIDPKYIFDDMCLKTEVDPWSDKKCPHCGESYYTPGVSCTTAVYYPPIYKDGVNINPDRNKVTTTYNCCACGKDWTEET